MQRTHRAVWSLCGLSCLLLLGGGCGQNDGGRCQVSSDCASGLICSEGTTGNGKCQQPGAAGTGGHDAATTSDADFTSNTGPEVPQVGPEAGPDSAAPDLVLPDATESEAGSVDTDEQG